MRATTAPPARDARRVLLVLLLALSLLAGVASVPVARAASVPPLPRAYDVTKVTQVQDLAFGTGLMAMSADGSTVVHLAADEDDEQLLLVATDLRTRATETVGIDLTGEEVERVESVAISADGRVVAFLAAGMDAADLHLPADADPQLTQALFVRDRLTGATRWVPVPALGVPASHHQLSGVHLSEDGTRLAVRITLPLPLYNNVSGAAGVLVATLAPDAEPAVDIIKPEALVPVGTTPAEAQPAVRGVALSGDGSVVAVDVYRATDAALLRFATTAGTPRLDSRELTLQEAADWSPTLDRTGEHTVLVRYGELAFADLVAGPAADVRLDRVATLPWVSGDQPDSATDRSAFVTLTPDGTTVAFIRSGALWTQPTKAGVRPALVSSGLDGRIAEPVSDTFETADRVVSYGIDGTGRTLAFQSDSAAFVESRSSHDPWEVLPAYLYRAVPTATAPGWPAGAALQTEPSTTSVTVRWPAATGEVAGYDVTVDGKPAAHTAAGSTTALLTGFDAGSTVEIAVVAVDAGGHASAPLTTTVTLLDEAPPGDAPLLATAGPGSRVHLEWEAAIASGVTGYRVLRDGTPIADLSTETTAYDDIAVAADTSYTYAIDVLRGSSASRFTREATVLTPALAISEAAWNLPKVSGSQLIAPAGVATFAIVGAAGFTARAEIQLRTLDGEIESITVPLPETAAAGTYRATWPVPLGIERIESATLTLADGVGQLIDRSVTGLPAEVGGLIKLNVTVPGSDPSGVRLQVWSDSTRTGYLTRITDSGVLNVPVVPGSDHRITTVRSDGFEGSAPQTVVVAGGRQADALVALYAPASLRLTVRTPDGQPLGDLAVALDTHNGPLGGRTDASGRVTFEHLDAGTEVTATVQLPPTTRATYGLAVAQPQTMTLVPGVNAVVMELSAMPKVTLRGTVTDAAGRPMQAAVDIRQDIAGVGVSVRTTSDSEGIWSVQVFDRVHAAVSATRGSLHTPEQVVDPAAPNSVELVLPEVAGYVVHPTLVVVLVDGQRSTQNLDTASAAIYHSHVTAGGERFAVVGDEVGVRAPRGSTVTFCADGAVRGLDRACAEAVAGTELDIPLTVELHEVARITGRVLNPDGTPRSDRTCFTLGGEGRTVVEPLNGSDLRISVPAAGTYVLRAYSCSGYVTGYYNRQVTLAAGEQLWLGDVRLSPQQVLLRGDRSSLQALPAEALPGQLAHLRAQIEFNDTSRSGTARLALPAGVSVPDNGVLRDGTVVPFTIEGDTLIVGLPIAQARTLDLYLRVPEVVGRELQFSVTVTSGELTELLGSAPVQVGMLTLTAPARSHTGTITLSGLAPSRSHVVVREGGTVVAEAQASDTGRWSAIVALGTTGDEARNHVLRASTTVSGRTLDSEPALIVVDPHAGALDWVTMSHGGITRSFRAADGVARFSFVWRATPTEIVAHFTGPVSDVQVHLGRFEGAMTQVAGQLNTWQLVATPLAWDVGDLSITYTPGQDRPLLPVPEEPETANALFDPTTAVLSDPVVENGKVSQVLTAAAPRLGANAQLRYAVSVEPLPGYSPDAAARAAARASGVPVYGPSLSASPIDEITSTGRWAGSAAAIVDLKTLAEHQETAALARTLSAAGFINGPARMVFEWAFWGATNGDGLYGAITADGKYDALQTLIDAANRCQDGVLGTTYANEAQRLMRRALLVDEWSVLSAVAGLTLAPATFGMGTVALWAVTWGIGKALELPLNNDIEALGRAIASDSRCRYSPDKVLYRPDAVISYAFDPSGIVYEGLANRPVEGVTATVLQGDSPDGPWHVWDASAFDNINPQLTDAYGAYGWDVPEGWWKVVFTKPGYLPTSSEVLRVLPPHTDVDVTMVRADLLAVDSVVADKTGLTVTFNQPVRVGLAGASGMLTVTGPDGTPVSGEWTPVSPGVAPAGHPYAGEQLATQFRFAGSRYSGPLTVTVDGFVQDHAGRAMGTAAEHTLSVSWPGPDTEPPTVQVTGVRDGATYVLGAVPTAGCVTSDAGSGVAKNATVSVEGGNARGVGLFTVTCAGAEDKAGNAAEPVTVQYWVIYALTWMTPPRGEASVKAGKELKLIWQIADSGGNGIVGLDAAGLTVSTRSCGAPEAAWVAEPASRLTLRGLPGGRYQLDWSTPTTYAGGCREVRIDLGEGAGAQHLLHVQFVR